MTSALAPYLVLAAVILAIGVAGLWCNGSFQWHHAGHHTAAALARAEDERTVLWLRDLHRVPIDLHLVPPLRWAWIRLAALRAVLAGATAPLPPVPKPGLARVRVDGPVPAPPGPERPEWTGELDDTGYLPKLTDWALNAPADEVGR